MFDFGVEKYGDEWWLSDNNYIVTNVTGLGAEAQLTTTSNANGTGHNQDSVNLEPRIINLTVLISNPTPEKRQQLFSYFSVGRACKLLIYNDKKTFYIDAIVQIFDPLIFSASQKVNIQLKAPKPYFLNYNSITTPSVATTASSVGKAYLTNDGETIGVVFTAVNNSENAIINPYFQIATEKLQLNTTIPAKATVKVCTVAGEKSATMTYQSGTSTTTVDLMPTRVDGSVFPQLPARGTSWWYVGCSGGTGTLTTSLSYRSAYNFV